MEKIKKSTFIWTGFLFVCAISIGSSLGIGLSETQNVIESEYITSFDTALPTKLLDINGEFITEFASDEKREIISLNKLPQHMIDALITREDRIFHSHNGFSSKALFRAFSGKLTGQSLGGGSTLTQQIAGTLFCDRTDMSMTRKLKELWWAIQMERRYSKEEILELYLNKIYFGGGTYGVNAASKYYFGHSAQEITPAEAAILVIQLSNPAFYNPFDHPNRAMDRQKDVLYAMVQAGCLSQEEADESFDDFWSKFDYTRTSTSAYMMRDDKAPWFSEYVRRELGNLIYGSQSIYTSGFTVNTTLNLSHQIEAQNTMERFIRNANKDWQKEHSSRSQGAYSKYVNLSELLSLAFNLPGIKVSEQRSETISKATFLNQINPLIDVVSMMCGIDSLKVSIINRANSENKKEAEKTTIEGTMVTLENETGYITALVGGSKFDGENQFIRAVQAKLQPGSTFKPLYYSAAIDSKNFTPATIISDTPQVFHTADGKPYIPLNFKGEWEGNVPVYRALIRSMNVPSIKILDGIGFESAIDRATDLLGISKDDELTRGFIPGYPIGLGVCSVRPIEMARAFSIFASGGKGITPIAIRTVEDKNGNIILNPEKDLRKKEAAKGNDIQVISPQTAFVMSKLLEMTVNNGGTLGGYKGRFEYKNPETKRTYTMPAGGKTGTTQNWADAWTVGFTPYYTSAFWFGFDKPGQSLGLRLTGATLAGDAWSRYMSKIHEGMLPKEFNQPPSGVIQVTVCSSSGQIPSVECGDHKINLWFLAGTQPTAVCSVHSNNNSSALGLIRLQNEMYQSGQSFNHRFESSPLKLNMDIITGKNLNASLEFTSSSNSTSPTIEFEEGLDYNPFME